MAWWTQKPAWVIGEQEKKVSGVNEIINYAVKFYCIMIYGEISIDGSVNEKAGLADWRTETKNAFIKEIINYAMDFYTFTVL
jgi:hypothetical protein